MAITAQALIILVFMLVHVFAGKLRFLDVIPRSRWLSMAGGVSVAYVFVHIFPELAAAQDRLDENWQVVAALEHHVYLVALAGLAIFYGLERAVKISQARRAQASGRSEEETTTEPGIFWLHIASFALYNGLIAYLLVHREEQDVRGLLFFAGAMAVHFLVNDFGLRRYHKNTYRRIGRWVLASAVLVGWLTGIATELSRTATDVLFAVLAGGVVLNVLKEELPEERQSRFWPFAFGAAIYAVLLLLL